MTRTRRFLCRPALTPGEPARHIAAEQIAAEEIAELVVIEQKAKAITRELRALVTATGSTLMELPGVGPVVAAGTPADTGDVAHPDTEDHQLNNAPTRPLTTK